MGPKAARASGDCGGGGAHEWAAPVARVAPTVSFTSLSNDDALRIFARLSQEERLRLQLVSPAWRDLLRAPALWRNVDLSATERWRPERCVRALKAVSRLAAGGMRSLRMTVPLHHGGQQNSEAQTRLLDALVATVAANAATLSDLHLAYNMDIELACRVLEAGPALQSFAVSDMDATLESGADTERLAEVMSGQGVYAPLRVSALRMSFKSLAGDHAALLQSLERHSSLRELGQYQEGLDNHISTAMVDLAYAAARAGAVSFWFNVEDADTQAFTAQAARLVAGFPIRVLSVSQDGEESTVCADEFLAAVRASRTLQRLELMAAVFDDDDDCAAMFQALTGHPTLHELSLMYAVMPDDKRHALRAIAGLLAAQSALTLLVLEHVRLKHGDMRVILRDLASPHARLQRLELSEHPEFRITPQFVERVLGAAVLGCPSMREVTISADDGPYLMLVPEVEEALRNLNAQLAQRAADHN